jgi:hypothetical protein
MRVGILGSGLMGGKLNALNRPEQLRFHLGRAVANGVKEEVIEAA